MTPSIGRIVHYRLTQKNCDEINRRRDHARINMDIHREAQLGTQVHVGSQVVLGDVCAATIVEAWTTRPKLCD